MSEHPHPQAEDGSLRLPGKLYNLAYLFGGILDEGLLERASGASETFLNAAVCAYERLQTFAGALPPAMLPPEPKVFGERILALAPAHAFMEQNGWQPRIVFFNPEPAHHVWVHVLHSAQAVMRANVSAHVGMPPVSPAYSRYAADASVWRAAVVNATESPAFTNVSADGGHGPNAQTAVEALGRLLQTLPFESRPSEGSDVIGNASASRNAYLALQLDLLLAGQPVADMCSTTISNGPGLPNSTTDALPHDATYVGAYGGYNNWMQHRVPCSFHSADYGIRPAVTL